MATFHRDIRSFILLMVQKSGDHQLRLVVYSIIYRVSAPSQVVFSPDFFHYFRTFQNFSVTEECGPLWIARVIFSTLLTSFSKMEPQNGGIKVDANIW